MTTTPTLTLTAFLEARIAEDERTAQAAGHGETHLPIGIPMNAGWLNISFPDNCRPDYDVRHIARFDPARVLAECEAKRAVVALHAGVHECVGVKYGELATVYVSPGFVYELDPTLRALAAVYSDHEDYCEDWRP